MEDKEFYENEWEQNMPPENEMPQIQKSIRRRNWKLIAISVATAAMLLLVCVYGIIPLIESFYWHPDTESTAANASDLELTLHTYAELFCPGWEVSYVNWQERDGLAAYDLQIYIRDQRDLSSFYLNGTLEKGHLMFGSDFADHMASPSWFSGMVEEFAPVEEDRLTETREKLAQLPDYIALEAAITFPEDLDMAQLEEFYREYGVTTLVSPRMRIIWVGIRNSPADPVDTEAGRISPMRLCGMDPFTGGTGFLGTDDTYPNFSNHWEYPHEEALENHFKSLLQYSSDRCAKDEGIPVWYGKDYYQTVLDYVEENGVMSYGAVVVASPQVLLELLDQGVISYVSLLDAWIDLS